MPTLDVCAHLYLPVEEPGVNFSLLFGEETHVIKVEHLPIGWPVLTGEQHSSYLAYFLQSAELSVEQEVS